MHRAIPAVLLLSFGLPARANMAALQRNEASLEGPRVGPTKVRVVSETLTFDCRAQGTESTCLFEAIYRLENPEPSEAKLDVTFVGVRTTEVAAAQDGVPVPVRRHAESELEHLRRLHPGAPDERLLDHAARKAGRTPDERDPPPSYDELSLSIPAGAQSTVRVTGRMAAARAFAPGYDEIGAYARHLAVAPRVEHSWEYQYLLAPIRTWGGVGPVEVVVRLPEGVRFDDRPTRRRAERVVEDQGFERPWEITEADGARVARLRFENGEFPPLLVFRLGTVDPDRPYHGPLAGVATSFGEEKGTRAYLGWELAIAREWLAGATVETNFSDEVVLVPLARRVTDMMCVIPSLGLGAGVPIQWRDGVRPGLRLQGDVAFGPVGAFLAGDVFPTAEEGRRARISIGLQLGI